MAAIVTFVLVAYGLLYLAVAAEERRLQQASKPSQAPQPKF
jgi:hypothetical protein